MLNRLFYKGCFTLLVEMLFIIITRIRNLWMTEISQLSSSPCRVQDMFIYVEIACYLHISRICFPTKNHSQFPILFFLFLPPSVWSLHIGASTWLGLRSAGPFGGGALNTIFSVVRTWKWDLWLRIEQFHQCITIVDNKIVLITPS